MTKISLVMPAGQELRDNKSSVSSRPAANEPVSQLVPRDSARGTRSKIRYWSKTSSKSNWVPLLFHILFWLRDKSKRRNQLTATFRIILIIIVKSVPPDNGLVSSVPQSKVNITHPYHGLVFRSHFTRIFFSYKKPLEEEKPCRCICKPEFYTHNDKNR